MELYLGEAPQLRGPTDLADHELIVSPPVSANTFWCVRDQSNFPFQAALRAHFRLLGAYQ